MPEILAIAGLVVGTLAYFLLVRRRASVRSGLQAMSRALAASNQIALQRLHLRSTQPAAPTEGIVERDRRSGTDRRKADHRRFGRGRRSGGDRRRGGGVQ